MDDTVSQRAKLLLTSLALQYVLVVGFNLSVRVLLEEVVVVKECHSQPVDRLANGLVVFWRRRQAGRPVGKQRLMDVFFGAEFDCRNVSTPDDPLARKITVEY